MAVKEIRAVEGGKCTKVHVQAGDTVSADTVLVETEADKETRQYKAPAAGKILETGIKEGEFSRLGQLLVKMEAEEVQTKPAENTQPKAAEKEEIRIVEGGKCTKIAVKAGDKVTKGQVIAETEADKETRQYKAGIDGVVAEIGLEEGKYVRLGQVAAVIMAEEKEQIEELRVIEGGKCTKVAVKPGDEVRKGQVLIETEADKETRQYKAPVSGVVKEVCIEEGAYVKLGRLLVSVAAKEVAEEETEAEEKEDLVIIGGGVGGYVSAIYAAKKGMHVTLIEKDKLGGTCLNVGCIPTKTLIRSAEVNRLVNTAETFGIHTEGKAQPDMNRIIDRKNAVVRKLVSGIEFLMKKNAVKVIRGTAAMKDDHTVTVEAAGAKTELSFRNLIIASGSKISRLNIPGIDLPCVINSTQALEMRELPARITVIGGGVIGLEFAFLYSDLGAEVTVVEYMDRVIPVNDHDLSEEIVRLGKAKGIRFALSARVTEIREENGQAVTVYEKDGRQETAVSDKVLVAVGREPNMDGLELQNTSIVLNERNRGIKVNEYMRTNVEHIYAVGDVNNLIQLAHAAEHQGIIAVDDMLGNAHPFRRELVPSVIFTSPEIASVGFGEDDLKKAGKAYKTGRFSYASNGKALAMGESEGYVKIMKDENDVILGGAVIGADAASLIEVINTAVTNGLKDSDLQKMTFAHPTTAEVVYEAAMDLGIGALHE